MQVCICVMHKVNLLWKLTLYKWKNCVPCLLLCCSLLLDCCCALLLNRPYKDNLKHIRFLLHFIDYFLDHTYPLRKPACLLMFEYVVYFKNEIGGLILWEMHQYKQQTERRIEFRLFEQIKYALLSEKHMRSRLYRHAELDEKISCFIIRHITSLDDDDGDVMVVCSGMNFRFRISFWSFSLIPKINIQRIPCVYFSAPRPHILSSW